MQVKDCFKRGNTRSLVNEQQLIKKKNQLKDIWKCYEVFGQQLKSFLGRATENNFQSLNALRWFLFWGRNNNLDLGSIHRPRLVINIKNGREKKAEVKKKVDPKETDVL